MKITSITTKLNFKNTYSQNTKSNDKNTIIHKEYYPDGQVKTEEYKDGTIVGYNDNGDFAYEITRHRKDK